MDEEGQRVYQYILLISIAYLTILKQVSCACHSDPSQLSASKSPQHLYSDNFPEQYDPFADCKWLIQASNTSQSIKIEIRTLDIEYSTTCKYDKLVFYDGSTTSATILATLCGQSTPIIISSGPSLLIHFTSDWGIQERGFNLQYSAVIGEDSTSNFLDKYQDIATIVGASIGGIVIACVFIYIIWLGCYTFFSKNTTPRATNRCAPTPDLYHTSASGQFCDYPVGPPSYEFAVPTSPPPPYAEVDPNPPTRSFLQRMIDLSVGTGRPRRQSRMRPSRPLSAVTHRLSLFGSRNAPLFRNVRMTNDSQPSCIIVSEAEMDAPISARSSSNQSPTRRYSQSPSRNQRSPRRSSPNRASVHNSRRTSTSGERGVSVSPRRARFNNQGRSTESSRRASIHSPRRLDIQHPAVHDANNNMAPAPVPNSHQQDSSAEVPILLRYSSIARNEVPILQPVSNSNSVARNEMPILQPVSNPNTIARNEVSISQPVSTSTSINSPLTTLPNTILETNEDTSNESVS